MEMIKLSDHHQSVIDNYLQFTRYQRQQYLKSVETSFQDTLRSRLLEETYTKEEVIEMITNLKDIIYVDLETELVNFSHTNILLLNQLFVQAEKWHLQLNADISEIQNRELLEEIRNIEKGTLKLDRPKLTPIVAEDHPNDLLRLEVLKLQNENSSLTNDVKELREKISKLTDDKEELNSNCQAMRDKMSELLDAVEVQHRKNAENDVNEILPNQESNCLPAEQDKTFNTEEENALQERMSAELDSMKNQIAVTNAQLTLAEQELEKKFNKTAAYENMKKIITKKNEQIKELRKQLTKYVNQPEEVPDNNL